MGGVLGVVLLVVLLCSVAGLHPAGLRERCITHSGWTPAETWDLHAIRLHTYSGSIGLRATYSDGCSHLHCEAIVVQNGNLSFAVEHLGGLSPGCRLRP
ncbi:MAG: hypothetical protein HC876_01080 [Chloroflexaceae bacterium]|nr:hypothetical protein [Chloroflexaceae bacterium]